MTSEKPTNNTPQGPELIANLQKRFANLWQILAAETNPDERDFFVEEYLRDLEERAYLETTIANQYRDRYLVELVQNAVDAMHRQAESAIAPVEPTAEPPVSRCHIRLTDKALYVANDGRPFQAEDVRSITAMGKSTKGVGRYIGYKGLGFRAVLEISTEPEIYSGQYRFGFSREKTLELLRNHAPGVEIGDVPTLSVPFLLNPENLPGTEKSVLQSLEDQGFATVIRLPLKAGAYSEVALLCREFQTFNSLLFLPYITELSLQLPGEPVARLTRENRQIPPLPGGINLAVLEEVALTLHPENKTEYWLLASPLEQEPISTEMRESLNDRTWLNVQTAGLKLAFPLSSLPGGGFFFKRRLEPLPFFTHFPTRETSGAGVAIHADFYLPASRKEIEENLPYNRWLAQKVAAFICNGALPELQERFPDEANLPDLLADIAYHNGPFGHFFRQTLDDLLAITPFVPVGGGEYRKPSEVSWTPLSGAGVLLFRKVFTEPPGGLHYPVLQLEDTYLAEEEGFDYRRVRRFLHDLGMRPVAPDRLPGLMPQAYRNLEEGLCSVSDLCATLALWFEQLARGTLVPEERQRALLQEARNLAVLPVEQTWEKPAKDIVDWPATDEGFQALKARRDFFGPVKVIAEFAYSPENREFEQQIRKWHKRLGVKTLDPEPESFFY